MVKYGYILKAIENHTLKTHDGAGFKRTLTQSLNKWAETHRTIKDHEEMAFYDDNGKEIFTQQNGEKDFVTMTDEDFNRVFNEETYHGLNLTHNHNSLYIDEVPTYLSTTDRDILLVKNNEGEYCFRSISAETPNGTRVSIAKNNKFTKENEDDYKYVFNEYNHACATYYDTYKDSRNKHARQIKQEYNKQGRKITGEELKEKSKKKAIKEIGTMKQYLTKKGYFDMFQEANCKLWITDNED